VTDQSPRLASGRRGGELIRIHPLWFAFIKFCEQLRYGEIARLKIQDGLPLSAEEVKRKIKFAFQKSGERNGKEDEKP
jgi:hypothetical protein